MRYIDLSGKKFGRLLVIRRISAPEHVRNKKSTYFECLCDCGVISIVVGADLRGGHTKSCGCRSSENAIDLVGQRFEKLIVVQRIESPNHLSGASKKAAHFICKCDCGRETIVKGSSLRRGSTKSCGCTNDLIDLIGQRFEDLLVVEKTDTPKYIKDKFRAYFKCRCVCGKITIVAGKELRNGSRKSCGCRKENTTRETLKLSSAKVVYKRYADGDLTFDDFLILSQMNCNYCDAPPANVSNVFKNRKTCKDFSKLNGDFIYSGLDRVDSKSLHNKSNVVPCCITCNVMKLDLEVNDFKNQIEKIYNFYVAKDKNI